MKQKKAPLTKYLEDSPRLGLDSEALALSRSVAGDTVWGAGNTAAESEGLGVG